LDHPDQFPQGLGGIFFQYFQRQFPNQEIYEKTIEPMLGAILAAREPLPVEILQKLFNWKESELRKWLRKFGSLFPTSKENGNEVIKPYHKSLADWLADEKKAGEYFVSVMEGHRMLAKFGINNFKNGSSTVFYYFIRNLVTHLSEAHLWLRLTTLLSDASFLTIALEWRILQHTEHQLLSLIPKIPREYINVLHEVLIEIYKLGWVPVQQATYTGGVSMMDIAFRIALKAVEENADRIMWLKDLILEARYPRLRDFLKSKASEEGYSTSAGDKWDLLDHCREALTILFNARVDLDQYYWDWLSELNQSD